MVSMKNPTDVRGWNGSMGGGSVEEVYSLAMKTMTQVGYSMEAADDVRHGP